MNHPIIEPPFREKSAFNCPHCGAFANQQWFRAYLNFNPTRPAIGRTSMYLSNADLATAQCANCYNFSIWYIQQMIYPNKQNAPLPNADMPPAIKADYVEAGTIAELSPRGAAALLRLALQKLCKELGEKGNNINEDIAALVKKGLDPAIQQSLDIVRVIGNNAVHPGQIDVDNPETVSTLFTLLNIIVDRMISHPRAINDMYSKLPKGTLDAIQERDK